MKDDEKCLASMLLLCSVCLGCQDFFANRHLSGAAKHYEEVFILTLKKIDSFLKEKAEVNWDFLKRIQGHSITQRFKNLGIWLDPYDSDCCDCWVKFMTFHK